MEVRTYSDNIPIDITQKWTLFVKSHSENTIFQSPDIYSFYLEVKNYSPYAFVSFDSKNNINGILLSVVIKESKGLTAYFSSRAIISGGPLIAESSNKLSILEELLSTLVETLKRKTQYIQFRNFFHWTDDVKSVYNKYGFTYSKRQNLLIDTTDESKLISKISKSKLRQVKDGKKNGSIIRPPANISELKEFYQLLKQLYKKKIQKPLPDWSFFETFYNFSHEGKLGIIRLVIYGNKVIGGVIAPVTSNRNIYEWYIAGKDIEFKNNYPSVLATWGPVEFALENKLKHFDLMGLGVPDKPYGVRDFKLKFGGKPVFFGRFERRNNKILYIIIRQLYFLLYKFRGLF